jgi:hypothetical protein
VVGDTCWSCRAPVRAIVGVLVDPALTEERSGFLALADVDRILMAVVDRGALARRATTCGAERCACDRTGRCPMRCARSTRAG